MKGKGKSSQSESESDSFPYREWRETKAKTEANQLPQKSQLSDNDGKKTVKYRDDPVMNSIYEKILRESDKFEAEEILQPILTEQNELYQYNPHMICGKVINPHPCNNEERTLYGLEDEGVCQCFQLTGSIFIVLIGKVGFEPVNGVNANLYLPRDFYEYINFKAEDRSKMSVPDRLLPLPSNKFLITIKRSLRVGNSMNLLQYPYIIFDPHNLLYPTYICSWIDCKRRITLSNYIQSEKEVNLAVIYGSTCHRLLEWLSEKLTTVEEYYEKKKEVQKKLYDSMLYDMYLVDSSFDKFVAACQGSLNNIVGFFHKHVEQRHELQIDRYKRIYLKIDKLVASECMFRSSFFGLKGKIDLLLSGELIDKRTNKIESVFIPMELKTGKKVSDAHKRQTEIYNILVREKYKKPVVGLLYYSDTDMKFFRMEDPLSAFEIVVVHRNQIALNLIKLYQSPKIVLPSFAQGFMQCNFCDLAAICETTFKKIENQGITQGKDIEEVPSKYHANIKESATKYSALQVGYLIKWLKLIHLQQLQTKKFNTNYWKMGIANFKLPHSELTRLTSHLQNPTEKVRLQITHQCKTQQELGIFDNYYKVSQKMRIFISAFNLIEGCKIVEQIIDATKKQFAITIEMNNSQIEINRSKLFFFLQHELDNDVEIETFDNQFFGIMRNTVLNLIDHQSPLKDILLKENTEGKKKTKAVLELDADEEVEIGEEELEGLNKDQAAAYQQSVFADKFCLVEGMPGTGKTELIIRMIEKFSKLKKKILITTFTNRSLDNILERLAESLRVNKDIIIREGSQYSCNPLLKQFTSKSQSFTSIEDYKQYFNKKSIWFVTLSSLYIHHLPKEFDIVILDEASQCLQPVCIEAILRSKKFILIGDYKQLQPVIKSKEAFKQGMWLSLFQRLCKEYPQNTVALKKQYRMNAKIMALSNKLVYNGELELANLKIKDKAVRLCDSWHTLVSPAFTDIISPQEPIVFLNYDPIINAISKKYAHQEPLIRKVIETELTAYVYRTFAALDLPRTSISIISAYNTSVNRIVELLRQKGVSCDGHSSVLTIDKSQGIDKEVIILLIEKGNDELIENPRRLNVALTRAKSKLIIIGSESYLSNMRVWEGTLSKLLRDYQRDLTKQMIEEMMNYFVPDAP